MITTPPLVEAGVMAEFLGALVLIVTAILIEQHGTTKTSVAVNVLGLSFMLISTGIDIFVLPFLIIYLIIGLMAYLRKAKKAYFLFSSKSYGSLMFAVALLHLPYIQGFLPNVQLIKIWWIDLAFASTGLIVSCWLFSIPFTYFLGYLVKTKKKKRR